MILGSEIPRITNNITGLEVYTYPQNVTFE